MNLKNEEKCTMCQGTGWVPVPDRDRMVRQCECIKRRIRLSRIRKILADWPEYKDATLGDFRARNVRQQNAITMLRAAPRANYFIHGMYAQGKTRLMICQYRRLAEDGLHCEIRTSHELIDELRKTEVPVDFGKTAFESPVLKMVNLEPYGHLFIDDIEKAAARSEFRAESLFHLFDTIKRRQIGLTMTSNLRLYSENPKAKDLRKDLTDQVVSRIYQICNNVIDLG
jgi:DNA replication protein DnaC